MKKRKVKKTEKSPIYWLLAAVLLIIGLLVAASAKAEATAFGPVTLTATDGVVSIPLGLNAEATTIQLTGITGTVGLQLQGSLDNKTWHTILMVKPESAWVSLTATASGCYQSNTGGFRHVRVKALYVTSGVARVMFGSGKGIINSQATLATTPVP